MHRLEGNPIMTKTQVERKSPVKLPGRPTRTEERDFWNVVLEYADEGPGPCLVDLSHTPRLDIQGQALQGLLTEDIPVPDAPGRVITGQGMMITRMNAVQACLWLFGSGTDIPRRFEVTDITEGTVGLALLGADSFRIAEKLTDLDLANPKNKAPFLLQGPFSHVPCQVVVLANEPGREALVFTCSRGYAHDMVHALLEAGKEYGLRAAGEERFLQVLRALNRN
jgi:glycine cleavage system aminomethyltransferase T